MFLWACFGHWIQKHRRDQRNSAHCSFGHLCWVELYPFSAGANRRWQSPRELIKLRGPWDVTWSLQPLGARAALGQGWGGCFLMARMILVCLVRNTNIGAVPVHRESLDASLFPGFSASEIPVLQETVAWERTESVFHPHLIQFCLCHKCYFTAITECGKWALLSGAGFVFVLVGQVVVIGFHSWVELFLWRKKKKVDFHAHANRITEVPFWLIFSGFCEKILSSQAVLRGWELEPCLHPLVPCNDSPPLSSSRSVSWHSYASS